MINTALDPINKQASIFVSRRHKLTKISEALEVYAARLTSPAVAEEVKRKLTNAKDGEDQSVKITIHITRCQNPAGTYAVRLSTRVICEAGTQSFYGLTE